MKIVKIQITFLVFFLMVPLFFFSIDSWGDTKDIYELCQNPSEKDQEPEKKIEDVEKILSRHKYSFIFLQLGNSNYYSKNKDIIDIDKDVFTPPPEFT